MQAGESKENPEEIRETRSEASVAPSRDSYVIRRGRRRQRGRVRHWPGFRAPHAARRCRFSHSSRCECKQQHNRTNHHTQVHCCCLYCIRTMYDAVFLQTRLVRDICTYVKFSFFYLTFVRFQDITCNQSAYIAERNITPIETALRT